MQKNGPSLILRTNSGHKDKKYFKEVWGGECRNPWSRTKLAFQPPIGWKFCVNPLIPAWEDWPMTDKFDSDKALKVLQSAQAITGKNGILKPLICR